MSTWTACEDISLREMRTAVIVGVQVFQAVC